MSDSCTFCGGLAVGDAASWQDGQPRPPAPCPRCGEISTLTAAELTARILRLPADEQLPYVAHLPVIKANAVLHRIRIREAR